MAKYKILYTGDEGPAFKTYSQKSQQAQSFAPFEVSCDTLRSEGKAPSLIEYLDENLRRLARNRRCEPLQLAHEELIDPDKAVQAIYKEVEKRLEGVHVLICVLTGNRERIQEKLPYLLLAVTRCPDLHLHVICNDLCDTDETTRLNNQLQDRVRRDYPEIPEWITRIADILLHPGFPLPMSDEEVPELAKKCQGTVDYLARAIKTQLHVTHERQQRTELMNWLRQKMSYEQFPKPPAPCRFRPLLRRFLRDVENCLKEEPSEQAAVVSGYGDGEAPATADTRPFLECLELASRVVSCVLAFKDQTAQQRPLSRLELDKLEQEFSNLSLGLNEGVLLIVLFAAILEASYFPGKLTLPEMARTNDGVKIELKVGELMPPPDQTEGSSEYDPNKLGIEQYSFENHGSYLWETRRRRYRWDSSTKSIEILEKPTVQLIEKQEGERFA